MSNNDRWRNIDITHQQARIIKVFQLTNAKHVWTLFRDALYRHQCLLWPQIFLASPMLLKKVLMICLFWSHWKEIVCKGSVCDLSQSIESQEFCFQNKPLEGEGHECSIANSKISRIVRVAAASGLAKIFRIVLPSKVKIKDSTSSFY